MDVIKSSELNRFKDKNVTINGWVYNSRRSGKIGFLIIRDGFGMVQGIIEKSHVGENSFKDFKKLTQESSISIKGKVVKNERAIGGFEIFVDSFIIIQSICAAMSQTVTTIWYQ